MDSRQSQSPGAAKGGIIDNNGSIYSVGTEGEQGEVYARDLCVPHLPRGLWRAALYSGTVSPRWDASTTEGWVRWGHAGWVGCYHLVLIFTLARGLQPGSHPVVALADFFVYIALMVSNLLLRWTLRRASPLWLPALAVLSPAEALAFVKADPERAKVLGLGDERLTGALAQLSDVPPRAAESERRKLRRLSSRFAWSVLVFSTLYVINYSSSRVIEYVSDGYLYEGETVIDRRAVDGLGWGYIVALALVDVLISSVGFAALVLPVTLATLVKYRAHNTLLDWYAPRHRRSTQVLLELFLGRVFRVFLPALVFFVSCVLAYTMLYLAIYLVSLGRVVSVGWLIGGLAVLFAAAVIAASVWKIHTEVQDDISAAIIGSGAGRPSVGIQMDDLGGGGGGGGKNGRGGEKVEGEQEPPRPPVPEGRHDGENDGEHDGENDRPDHHHRHRHHHEEGEEEEEEEEEVHPPRGRPSLASAILFGTSTVPQHPTPDATSSDGGGGVNGDANLLPPSASSQGRAGAGQSAPAGTGSALAATGGNPVYHARLRGMTFAVEDAGAAAVISRRPRYVKRGGREVPRQTARASSVLAVGPDGAFEVCGGDNGDDDDDEGDVEKGNDRGEEEDDGRGVMDPADVDLNLDDSPPNDCDIDGADGGARSPLSAAAPVAKSAVGGGGGSVLGMARHGNHRRVRTKTLPGGKLSGVAGMEQEVAEIMLAADDTKTLLNSLLRMLARNSAFSVVLALVYVIPAVVESVAIIYVRTDGDRLIYAETGALVVYGIYYAVVRCGVLQMYFIFVMMSMYGRESVTRALKWVVLQFFAASLLGGTLYGSGIDLLPFVKASYFVLAAGFMIPILRVWVRNLVSGDHIGTVTVIFVRLLIIFLACNALYGYVVVPLFAREDRDDYRVFIRFGMHGLIAVIGGFTTRNAILSIFDVLPFSRNMFAIAVVFEIATSIIGRFLIANINSLFQQLQVAVVLALSAATLRMTYYIRQILIAMATAPPGHRVKAALRWRPSLHRIYFRAQLANVIIISEISSICASVFITALFATIHTPRSGYSILIDALFSFGVQATVEIVANAITVYLEEKYLGIPITNVGLASFAQYASIFPYTSLLTMVFFSSRFIDVLIDLFEPQLRNLPLVHRI